MSQIKVFFTNIIFMFKEKLAIFPSSQPLKSNKQPLCTLYSALTLINNNEIKINNNCM